MGILLASVGGLLFLYFNIKCWLKINFTYSFFHVYFYIIIFKKRHVYEKTINYSISKRIINRYQKNVEVRHKFKKRLKYFKYIKKVFPLFYIKNISFYPECIFDRKSFSIEFVIVNSLLKKSLLNG